MSYFHNINYICTALSINYKCNYAKPPMKGTEAFE